LVLAAAIFATAIIVGAFLILLNELVGPFTKFPAGRLLRAAAFALPTGPKPRWRGFLTSRRAMSRRAAPTHHERHGHARRGRRAARAAVPLRHTRDLPKRAPAF